MVKIRARIPIGSPSTLTTSAPSMIRRTRVQGTRRRKAHEHQARFPPPEIVLEVVADSSAGAHARARHDDGGTDDPVDGHGFRCLAGEAQAGQVERVAARLEQSRGLDIVAFWVALEDLGSRDRHRRVQKHGQVVGQCPLLDPLAQENQRSSCARSRANEGMTTLPPRSWVSRIA